MAVPFVIYDVARALYECDNTSSVDFNDSPPTEQIAYIEKSEIVLGIVANHINNLATHIQAGELQMYSQKLIQSLAKTLQKGTNER